MEGTLEGSVVEDGEQKRVAGAFHLGENGLAGTTEVDEGTEFAEVALDAREIVAIHVVREKNTAPFPGARHGGRA